MVKILLATGNPHKARELSAMLSGCDVEVLTLKDVGFAGEIIEDGETFEENAEIKARAAASLGYIGVGDDSGLCVDFLGGAPGVYSARYAGEPCDNSKNNEKLLSEIAESTGGRYFRATDNTKLAEIYSEINKMEKARTTVDSFPVYKELFGLYALLALLALLLEFFIDRFVLRRLP